MTGNHLQEQGSPQVLGPDHHHPPWPQTSSLFPDSTKSLRPALGCRLQQLEECPRHDFYNIQSLDIPSTVSATDVGTNKFIFLFCASFSCTFTDGELERRRQALLFVRSDGDVDLFASVTIAIDRTLRQVGSRNLRRQRCAPNS